LAHLYFINPQAITKYQSLKMKPSLLLSILLFNSVAVLAQTSFKGRVTDAENNRPIPYVSIGIINKADGTVSNIEGEFKLDLIAGVNDSDTLRISSIGYQSRVFLVGELTRKFKEGALNVALLKTVTELKPVAVNAKHATVKILGYPTTSKLLGVGFGTNSIGSQGGIKLAVKQQNTNIESLSFFIIQNSFESLTFRVNVYQMTDGRPGDNILTGNVIFKVEGKQTGKITVDLTPYDIYVDKDVLIALEWIEAKPAASGTLDVAAVVFGSTYFRQASQYYWKKKGTGLGLSVKINY